MLEHFGDITMIQEVLQQAQTGLWIIEIEEGKEPRMYADRAMLGPGMTGSCRNIIRRSRKWWSR